MNLLARRGSSGPKSSERRVRNVEGIRMWSRVVWARKLLVCAAGSLSALGLAACGGGGAAPVTQIPPMIQNPDFVFVSNTNSNTISVLEINPQTGQLAQAAEGPFAAGSAPEFLTVDASGNFLYVANNNSNDVSAFRIDGTTGSLTPMAGSPFPAGAQPKGLVLVSSANLNVLYVANESSNDISAFKIDPATGALTVIPGSPFLGVQSPLGITANPAGTFLYVNSLNSNFVS